MIKCEELLENWLLFSCLCLVMKVFPYIKDMPALGPQPPEHRGLTTSAV